MSAGALSNASTQSGDFLADWEPLYRLSAEQFQQMVAAGIFAENEAVELHDGLLYEKQPQDPRDPLYRLSVSQYTDMIDSGILLEDEPVELLEGLLAAKMGKKPLHWIVSDNLRIRLEQLQLPGYFVHSQNPVATSDSEPEPDIAVVRGSRDDYATANPTHADSDFVVEVSDTTLSRDRGWKKRIYARAGIPTYWIVNLVNSTIEVRTEPTGPGPRPDYRHHQVFAEDQSAPVIVGGRTVAEISLHSLLPAKRP